MTSDLGDLLEEKSTWDLDLLHRDNEILLQELDELDNDDSMRRFCTGFECLIIRLFRLRLSNKQVQVVMEEMMMEMKLKITRCH